MTVKIILTEPNKILRQVSEPVEKVGQKEQKLMDRNNIYPESKKDKCERKKVISAGDDNHWDCEILFSTNVNSWNALAVNP